MSWLESIAAASSCSVALEGMALAIPIMSAGGGKPFKLGGNVFRNSGERMLAANLEGWVL